MRIVNVYFSGQDARVPIAITADVDLVGVVFGSVIVTKDPSLTYTGFFNKADNSYDNDLVVIGLIDGFRARLLKGDTIFAVGGAVGPSQLIFDDPPAESDLGPI